MRHTHPEAAIHIRRNGNTQPDNDSDDNVDDGETRDSQTRNGRLLEHASGSESEVEIFAVEDDSERQPLTPYTHTT